MSYVRLCFAARKDFTIFVSKQDQIGLEAITRLESLISGH